MQTLTKENAVPKKKAATSEPNADKLLEKQQWNDIFVRAYFGDNGVYPRDGVLSHSPDIIPLGENPVGNPYDYLIANNWNNDLGQNVYAKKANYIYMRGQNLSTASRFGRLYLYYSKASLILWPEDKDANNKGWKHQNIPTASGTQYSPVYASNGGSYVVTNDPFYWVPENIENDHYCLIGRVETDENPNPIPDKLDTVEQFAEYIATRPNMCWRNVTTINANQAVNTSTVRYDQGTKEEKIYIFIECTNAPVGAYISFSCGTAGPTPPIKLDPTKIANEGSFTSGGNFLIPANFSSNISYTYDSKGLHPPENMKIELKCMLTLPPTHRLYQYGSPLAAHGLSETEIEKLHREYGIAANETLRAIKLGSHQMQSINKPNGSPKTAKVTDEPVDVDYYMRSRSYHWLEERKSIFGNSYTEQSIKTKIDEGEPSKPEEVSWDSVKASAGDPGFRTVVDFCNGDNAGKYNIAIHTLNIPKGCEVAFDGGTDEFPIKLSRSEVNGYPTYAVGITKDLPANFSAPITFSFWQNGKELPKDIACTVELKALLHLEPPPGHGPIPGKKIGSVTAFLH